MNQVVFKTEGDWDSTTLTCNGRDWPAAQMLVQIEAGRDEYGSPARGGVRDGGQMSAVVRSQDNPDQEQAIFPGTLQMNFPGHEVVVENVHPNFDFEFTRVLYNQRDVTEQIVDLTVNIDAVNNEVQAVITLYRPHWLGADEVATITIL